MKINKFLFAPLTLALATSAFAQEWDNYDTGYEEETEEPSVTLGGSVELNARAYIEASEAELNSTTGKMEYADRPDWDELKTAVFPSGKLTASYSGLSSDVNLSLKFDKTSLNDGYYWDILDEFVARAYVGNAQIEAGKMRVVWGKGDKVHVLDNFNANDYTDYIIPDYIDRRISEPMFRAVYSTNNNVKFEAVYTPMMTPDRLADSGVWQPKAAKKLTSTMTDLVKGQLAESLATVIGDPTNDAALESLFANLQFDANSLYPDTNQLKYGQAGVRTTFTVGGVDLGFSYYYGHNKTVTADTLGIIKPNVQAGVKAGVAQQISDATTAAAYYTSLAAAETDATKKAEYEAAAAQYSAGAAQAQALYDALAIDAVTYPSLNYDMVQVFGFEGAAVLFSRLNSRFEFAYNLTKDIKGDDPFVHNNSLAWVAGFDIDLPIHNINLNVQENGKYILNYDKLDDVALTVYEGTPAAYTFKLKEYDADYTSADTPWNNKIIVNLSDTFNHEKIKLDIKGIYGIERGDLLIMPSLSFTIKDDFKLNLSGLYIWCKDSDSEFDGWERNSFAQIGCKYTF